MKLVAMVMVPNVICIQSLYFAEEREKPELLAESRERRIRVAEESEKTEQEVQSYYYDLITMFFLYYHSATSIIPYPLPLHGVKKGWYFPY